MPTASTFEQPPPVEALGDACHPRARVRRLDLELLADERLRGGGPRGGGSRLRAYSSKRMHPRLRARAAGVVRHARLGARSSRSTGGSSATTTRTSPSSARRSRAGAAGFRSGSRSMRRTARSSGSRSTRSRSAEETGAACAAAGADRAPDALLDGRARRPLPPSPGRGGGREVFSVKAFGQATVRHAVFGLVLGVRGAERPGAGPARKPASSRSGIRSVSPTGSPSKRSTARRLPPVVFTCSTSAASAGRAIPRPGSRSETIERPPRSTKSAGSPPRRTTCAPATLAARPPASFGHGRAAP